jgi:hypothetical protein
MLSTARLLCTALFLLAGLPAFAQVAKPPAEDARIATVKRLAAQMLKATTDGNYAVIIDLTYPKIVAEMGGRANAIQAAETMMQQVKEAKFVIKELKTAEPGPFHRQGANTFIVVPTFTVIVSPEKTMRISSYLLGISPDGGQAWTFIDGAGLRDPDLRRRILPEMPGTLTLPEMSIASDR